MSVGAAIYGVSGAETKQLNGTLAVLSFLYLSVVSVVANTFDLPAVAFFLAPLPLLLFKFDSFPFLCIYSACNLFFFTTLNFGFLQPADACLLVFLAVYFINRNDAFSITIPRNSVVLFLYLFLAYVFIMAIGPLHSKGPEFWLMYDVKKYLVLATAVFFITQPLFGPKKIVLLLLVIIAFTALHGSLVIGNFLITQSRQVTWNEIYYGNSSIVCIVLLGVVKNRKYKLFLSVAALITIIALLATETRSIWISTTLCIAAYLLVVLWSKLKKFEVKQLAMTIVMFCFLLMVIELFMRLFLHTDLPSFLFNRMTEFNNNELLSPFTSLGYRLYESFVVWTQRSFWGHGTGAYLYLVQTQFPEKKFMYWPSIHSEYIEMLHKWGFFGLGLYLLFIGAFLKQSLQLFLSGKKFISAIGAIAFLTICNTLVTSITSSYITRVNMIIWDILMIGVVVNYRKRMPKRKLFRITLFPGRRRP